MPQVYFATQSYQAQSEDSANERLVNAYLEHAPEGAKSQTPVYGSPGITEFDDLSPGPIWGIHNASLGLGDLLYVVSGTTLYSVSDLAVATSLGTIKGNRRVSMTDNGAQLVIVNGLHHYTYTRDEGLLKTKFGCGMDGDLEISDDHDGTALTTMTMTITGGPTSALANTNEIIVSIEGDSTGVTFFTDRPGTAETLSTTATDLAATINAVSGYTASSSAGVITITPSGANASLDSATSLATGFHRIITIDDSFEADDYLVLTFEAVGASDVTVVLMITSAHTAATIASALQTLIDADGTLTATVGTATGTTHIITVYGQTAGTHILTDIYSTHDWAVISGQAPYAKQVWALDGYSLYPVTNTPSFMMSALNNWSRIDVLDIASIGAAETDIQGMCVNNREIFLFGGNFGEIYRNTGASGFPFTRIPGPHLEHGCASPYSIAKGENTFAWLGSDRRVYAMKGFTAQRISTHGIEHLINAFEIVDDAFALAIGWKGHLWYVLSFPTEGHTFVYDATTKKWHERADSYELAGLIEISEAEMQRGLVKCADCFSVKWISELDMFVAANQPLGAVFPGISLSRTGKRWGAVTQAQTYNNGIDWSGLTYSSSQGRIVVVGYGDNDAANYSMRSADGITWTFDSDLAQPGYSVDYSPSLDLFVAVGADQVAAWSADGITWTNVDVSGIFASNERLNGVAWSADQSCFVIIGSKTTNKIARSTDGKTWAVSTTLPPQASGWESVRWISAKSMFVATAGPSGYRAATSVDGNTWLSRTTTGTGASPAWGNKGVAYSSTLDLMVAPMRVAAGGEFRSQTSKDGVTWVEITGGLKGIHAASNFFSAECIEWSSDKLVFVMGGRIYPGGWYAIYWSDDGYEWDLATVDPLYDIDGVAVY